MEPKFRRDVFQWDTKNWSKAIPLWQKQVDELRPQKALAIGEREGGLSLWLASQGIKVHCTDLSEFPAATQKMHEDYGVSDLVVYDHQDATSLTFPDGSFDLVIFKSVLGALKTKERQRSALAEMYRVLRPGGALLFAENLKSTKFHCWLRSKFIKWEHYWRYLSLKEDKDLFSDFSERDLRTYGVLGALGRTNAQRDGLSNFDKVLSPISPSSWHYIIYGVCIK